MAIDTNMTSSGAGGTARPTASQTAVSKLSEDYNSFLTLLTAQIVNQDPLEPMDSTAFVSQLAQLTQVEQAVVTNANLEEINNRLAASGAMSDVMLLGRDVTLTTDRIALRDGQGEYAYELAGPAFSAKAVIRAEDGTIVREIPALATSADTHHQLVWDGLDNVGLPVPDGNFTIEIEALDGAGERVAYDGFSTATVEQLLFRSGHPVLALSNGLEASAASVVSVR